jgi:hypothetical protein
VVYLYMDRLRLWLAGKDYDTVPGATEHAS